MMHTAPVFRGGTFVFGPWNVGKVPNSANKKPSLSTIAGKSRLLYNVCIPVDYAYSTTIDIRRLKLKEDKPVRLTVRQCGDLS